MTQSAWERAWESYLYALGVKKNGCRKRWCEKGKPWIPVSIRSHDLRHSYCSMLYDAGIDLKTAMRWMGHADQDMTMQIYTHLSEKRRTAAEKALRKAEKNAFGSQFGSHLKIAKKKVAIKILDKEKLKNYYAWLDQYVAEEYQKIGSRHGLAIN